MIIPRYTLVTPPAVAAEVLDIYRFQAPHSAARARDVARQIAAAIASLEQLPLRYPVYETRRDPTLVVRRMVTSPYLIYYRVDEAQRNVRILAVRHGARRQPKRFR